MRGATAIGWCSRKCVRSAAQLSKRYAHQMQNTLQHTATHCNTLQHTCRHNLCAGCYSDWMVHSEVCPYCRATVERVCILNAKHTATHCSSLQRTCVRSDANLSKRHTCSMQHVLQHSATHVCPQSRTTFEATLILTAAHTATHCNTRVSLCCTTGTQATRQFESF